MNGDNTDSSTTLIPSIALFRGIYNRVAKRLGVDPSYVSRVARGERRSPSVEKALADEVQIIREHLNNHEDSNHNSNRPAAAPKSKLKDKSRSAPEMEA